VAALAALIALAGGLAAAQEKVVNVYNWSDYIDEDVLAEFTAETGIKVVYDVFDSNEILETKLLAGGSGYDVVVPSHYFLGRQITAGVFQKLDTSKLPNIGNMWPDIAMRVAAFDPGNEYSINYMWGTTGIGFVEEKVAERMADAPTNSWDMVFRPEVAAKFRDCGITWLDSPTEVIPMALRYLGLDPNSGDAGDLEKAEALLLSVRGTVQKFHSSDYINALANGDICVAIGWSGDVLQARDRASEAANGVTVQYTIPKEGTQMWFDQMAIPADAPHPDEAHAFINFMMKPEIVARSSNYVNYANGNLASQKFLDPGVLADTAIYPDAATVKNLFVVQTQDPATQRRFNRIWTKIKTGQ
jgi:putrescine transport system substrate-binding protein